MTKLLVGSTAAKTWFDDFREPHDIDYFVSRPEEKMSNSRGIEYFYHPYLTEWLETYDARVADPDVLYTIKVSHAFWSLRNRSWDKHMGDVVFFQNKDCSLIPSAYDLLYKTWVETHGEKRANLNVSATEFFTASVPRIYDHDSIHASVAYGDTPMFERILRDGSEVAVSRDKFESLSHQDKCNLLREEVYATALERILIPSDFTKSPAGAYHWALKQTITSFSKGWFPLWCVLNYRDIRKPDINYVERHNDNAHKLILLEAS